MVKETPETLIVDDRGRRAYQRWMYLSNQIYRNRFHKNPTVSEIPWDDLDDEAKAGFINPPDPDPDDDELTCPYCGYKDEDSWEINDTEEDEYMETECGRCGKTFAYSTLTVRSFYSKPVEGGVPTQCAYPGCGNTLADDDTWKEVNGLMFCPEHWKYDISRLPEAIPVIRIPKEKEIK